MTNFLSPLDPSFFLHHANMDRLWDVWTRKQKRLGLSYLPTGDDLDTLSKEPFLFFVDGNGNHISNGQAGDYLSTEKFEYDYEPGFGEQVVSPPAGAFLVQRGARPPIRGVVRRNAAKLTVSTESIKEHLAAPQVATLIAEITVPHPSTTSIDREFDVVVGAPADMMEVTANSPYYAGTIAFFGKMMNMEGMAMDATFSVPLPKAPQAFHGLTATANTVIDIRILPTHRRSSKPPALKAVSVRAL